jgi:hypothetical protein
MKSHRTERQRDSSHWWLALAHTNDAVMIPTCLPIADASCTVPTLHAQYLTGRKQAPPLSPSTPPLYIYLQCVPLHLKSHASPTELRQHTLRSSQQSESSLPDTTPRHLPRPTPECLPPPTPESSSSRTPTSRPRLASTSAASRELLSPRCLTCSPADHLSPSCSSGRTTPSSPTPSP